MFTLAKREKNLVIGAACFLGIFFLFHLLIFPFFEKKDRMEKGIKARETELEEMIRLSDEYEAYKGDTQGIEQVLARRNRGFTLRTFLQEKANEAGVIIGRIDQFPSKDMGNFMESTMEVKLEAVTLKQLMEYLYRIESPEDLVSVSTISIKQNKKEPGYHDVTLRALTFEET
ncbi:MAG: type II secretion system protein M [Deltaproteobacteria bacterium]|nr:type II secretion system protein M [Deltaproteobacteria bacterium]